MDPPRVFDATAAVGAVAWVAVGGLVAIGALRLVGPPTAALAVVLAVAVVVPMVARLADLPFRDGTRSRLYRAVAVLMPVGAAATVVSLALPTGSLAAALAVPWFATTVLLAVYGVQRGLPNAVVPTNSRSASASATSRSPASRSSCTGSAPPSGSRRRRCF